MKAITLMSGGLDSTLATKITKDLGIELVALNTVSAFCLCNHRSSSGCFHGVNSTAKDLNIKLISLNVAEELLEIVKKPKHGYGSNMNPCIDCRVLLFKKAKEFMQEEGASFVITGEVLGQRPMSQKLNTMRLIEKESGLEGFVVRPLSAKVLEPTIPEQRGWIDREKLLAINGRGRRAQFDLAKELGINDYPCPSGGCLLTDPEFSRKLKDLINHGEFNLREVQLLKLGRHFRLAKRAKLVVGRNEVENKRLLDLIEYEDYIFIPQNIAGPTALGRGEFDDELLRLSCAIASRYCDLNGNNSADIVYKKNTQEDKVFKAPALEDEKVESYRV